MLEWTITTGLGSPGGVVEDYFDRSTSPDTRKSPASWFLPMSDAGVRVTHENALEQSAVWACVRVIAESLSQLPWRCMQRTDRGNEVLDTHPADKLLYSAPNDLMTPAVWREVLLHDVLLWGNSYHEIVFDGASRPAGMYRIAPSRVTPFLMDNALYYLVKNQEQDDTILLQNEMFHVRGLGNELAGVSVIQHAMQAIGLAEAQEQSMASLIANGSRPAGIITPAGTLSEQSAERVREQWEATYGGGKNRGKTALLSHSMKYEPMSMPNTDAQMLESRRFSVLEICRFFRVPPHKVMDLERATFSNIEHQAIEFVQDTLVPWGVKLEQEANRKLIAPANRGRLFTKLNFNALLRGAFESRAKGYQMLFDRGVYSVNDILELEDRNTIGPEGDIRLVPLNMQSLEAANKPPEPPAPPPRIPQPEPDQDNMLAAYRPVIFDTVDRITSRECKLLMRDKSAKWISNGHSKYIVNQLVPHVNALARIAGVTLDVGAWADARCNSMAAEITAHLKSGGQVSELISSWVDRVEYTTDSIFGECHGTR